MAKITSEVEITIDVTLEDDGLGALAFTDPETPPQMFRISYDALYEEIDELYGNGRGGLITDPDDRNTVMKIANQLRELADDLANLCGQTLN